MAVCSRNFTENSMMERTRTLLCGLRGLAVLACMIAALAYNTAPAQADCLNPPATIGKTVFNRDSRVPQYCNGVDWVSMLPPRYAPTGVYFDGVNDYLTQSSALNGVADGKSFTASVWIKYEGYPGQMEVLTNQTGKLDMFWHGTLHNFHVLLRNSSSSIIAQVACGPVYPTVGQWYNYLISFDLTNPAKRFCYVNDVSDLTIYTYNDDVINYNIASPVWRVGGSVDGPVTDKFKGYIGDLWVDFNRYIDFSIEANRRKFITADGRPVYLGADGSGPTGTAPMIFLSGNVSNWHTNKGTGGGFTVSGSLTAADNNPGLPPLGVPPFTPARGNCTTSDGGPLGVAQVFDLHDGNIIGLWYQRNILFATEYADGTSAYRWNGTGLEFLANTPKIGAVAEGIWGDGDYIYVGDIGTLSVYSFDGNDFTLIDSIATNAAEARGVWGDGTYIYVANGSAGISAFTFDGTNLAVAGTPYNTSGFALGVWGDGPYIYLADNNGGLEVFTFDGTNFTLVTSNSTNSTAASRVWGKDSNIFVADQAGDVDAYFFNGATLTYRTSAVTPGSARGIWGDGTHVYVADSGPGGTSGLRVYSYNGVTLTLIDSDDTSGEALAVWGDGTRIFVGDGTDGMRVYDGYACGFGECTAPKRSAGSFVYNQDQHVMQFCDGAEWRALGAVPGAGGSGCTAPARPEGTLIFNNDNGVPQYCDGTSWRAIGYVQPCSSPGNVCPDGSVYAGVSPDGHSRMYVTAADQGTAPWNNGNNTNRTDLSMANCAATFLTATCTTGLANTAIMMAEDSDSGVAGIQPHQAAALCDSLTANGHSDWYLPAVNEAAVLYNNSAAIGGFSAVNYSTSSEWDMGSNWFVNMSTGLIHHGPNKDSVVRVRCVRKD